jgi:hypothetical protein
MALCVRSAAISVRTWCRIGRPTPRRGHPDNLRSTLRLRFPQRRQQNIDFSKVEIKTIDLGHNTYRLEGQGGNVTVAVGSDGIIMVDGQFAPLRDKIKAAISPLPMKSTEITPAAMKPKAGSTPLAGGCSPYRTRLHRLSSLLTGKRTGNLAKTGFRCRF